MGTRIDRPPRNEVTSSQSVLRPLSLSLLTNPTDVPRRARSFTMFAFPFTMLRVVVDRKIELCFAKIALFLDVETRTARRDRESSLGMNFTLLTLGACSERKSNRLLPWKQF